MAEKQAKEVKKSPKKVIIFAVIGVILIGAGAAGSYFFLSKKMSDSAHGAGKEKEESVHEKADEPDVFYALSTPLIVDFPAGESAKVIKISLSILVSGEASVGALKKHEPMIRNNLLMAISALGAEKAKTTEGKQELRAKMLTEVGKVLEMMAGKNTAKDVYFTEFVMQ